MNTAGQFPARATGQQCARPDRLAGGVVRETLLADQPALTRLDHGEDVQRAVRGGTLPDHRAISGEDIDGGGINTNRQGDLRGSGGRLETGDHDGGHGGGPFLVPAVVFEVLRIGDHGIVGRPRGNGGEVFRRRGGRGTGQGLGTGGKEVTGIALNTGLHIGRDGHNNRRSC